MHLSATCQDYASDKRLKDDIQKAVGAVLRGRRFFCEPVSLRAIDLDIRVRPLFPCSAEFLPEMEKCAEHLRTGYGSQSITAARICRYLFFLVVSRVKSHFQRKQMVSETKQRFNWRKSGYGFCSSGWHRVVKSGKSIDKKASIRQK